MPAQRGQAADFYHSYVVIGTSAGKVKLVDLARNRVITTIQIGGGDCTVFHLDWNPQGYLAIASTE